MAEVPLQEWVEARLTTHGAQLLALEKRIQDVDERAKEAIREARDAASAAAARQNEWRATVNDVASTKIDRSTAEARFDALGDRISLLAKAVDGMQGKSSGIGASVSLVISLLSLAAVVIFELLRK